MSVVCVGQNVATTGGEMRGPPHLAALVCTEEVPHAVAILALDSCSEWYFGAEGPIQRHALLRPRIFSLVAASEYVGTAGHLRLLLIQRGQAIDMQELIAEQPKNWLQLYVDAMTEKNPLKRLALVRQLRQIPRHDESDDSLPRTGLQLVTSRRPTPAKAPVQTSKNQRSFEKSRAHLVRTQKTKQSARAPSRRNTRMRSA